ncbi:hypothetical protein [Pontibacillus yanchengensis]|uniref:Uncharacterized protein n=1 Tax=Pontibacillus yanchengensis Y32 TaxID=1385514 RepID=A0A0A2TEP3_9BACI|nr:hypothetical protein [Pontibacillus yanchengensis]KGP72858.1 hypothetical protein N782_10125 [Pontibacillus yanchengensis Y32]
MNDWTDFETGIIHILTSLLGWGSIIFLVIYIYRKNKTELSLWKVFLITYIGMFTFDYTLQISGDRALFPILPLGVWLIFGFFCLNNKEKSWHEYRPFAWVGFGASFLFFSLGILGSFLHDQVYYRGELSTYIASVNQPQLVTTHPSGENPILKEDFQSSLPSFQQSEFNGMEWFKKMEQGKPKEDVMEIFPYVLKGTEPQFGSGIQPLIYIKRDGKGILVHNENGDQLFFESEYSLFKEVQ